MSGMLMERAILLKTPLSHAAMRVLMLLAKHADDDGTNCFPSMQTIEDTGQMSRGTVVRCLEQLVQAGFVVSERRRGRTGNTYVLQIPETVAPSDHSPPSKQSHHRTVNGPEQSHDRTVSPRPNGPIVGPKAPVNGPMVDVNSPIIGPDSRSKKKDSEANASDAEAASRPPSSRDLVWSQGVPLVRHLTGKTDAQCRSMLGRMLRDVQDDCPRLLMVLQQARDFQPIDPVAWLTAATKPRSVKAGRDERILRAAGLWDDGTDFDFDHEPRGMLQ